jgi:uncharacterized protein (TIGR02302 family)
MNAREDKNRDEPPVAWRVSTAVAALWWERVWPALWPALGFVFAFAALSLVNAWSLVPGWLHSLLLAAFGAAIAVALLRGLRGLSRPGRGDGRRRLERESGLAHRPLTALRDRLAGSGATTGDTGTQALWEAHRRRARLSLRSLRIGWPAGGWARVDPRGIRAALGLFLVIGLGAAGREAPQRLAHAFVPQFGAGSNTATFLDAWITPPEYTGLPPLFLRVHEGAADLLSVPAGSEMFARVHGGRGAPRLLIDEEPAAFEAIDAENYEVRRVLEAGEMIAIVQRKTTLGTWAMTVIADDAPEIAFADVPSTSVRQALSLSYSATDDYGITGVAVRIARADSDDSMKIALPLARPGLTEANESSFHDLTPHPWAGLPVFLRLAARDELGQTGISGEVEMILPERIFRHPVAKQIVEQRRVLALAPSHQDRVTRSLSELSARPDTYYDDLTAFLSLRSAVWRLRNLEPKPEVLADVIDLLWNTALRIEDGDLSVAEANLRAAQDALMEALARNVPDSEIDQRIEELREAMNRFLEALAERALAMQNDRNDLGQFDPDSLLTQDELQRLLDQAQELSRAGSRDAARELLSQVREMLENLREGLTDGELFAGQAETEMMLRELNELMREQQQLLDQTFRESQQGQRGQGGQRGRRGPQGERSERGEQFGEGRQQGLGRGPALGSLAERQEALRRMLGELMRRLGEGNGDIPGALGRAERQMDNARGALEDRRPGKAVGPQTSALDQLRQGAAAIIREMMEQLGDDPGLDGTNAPFNRVGRDPLGRPQAGFGSFDDDRVQIPNEDDVQKAHDILRELYRRAAERNRPKPEQEYIERLLRRF